MAALGPDGGPGGVVLGAGCDAGWDAGWGRRLGRRSGFGRRLGAELGVELLELASRVGRLGMGGGHKEERPKCSSSLLERTRLVEASHHLREDQDALRLPRVLFPAAFELLEGLGVVTELVVTGGKPG